MTGGAEKVTAYLPPDVRRYLEQIASQEFRSSSSTIALLIVKEATRRGMVARAPELVSDLKRSPAAETGKK